jgi:hypothetical protein
MPPSISDPSKKQQGKCPNGYPSHKLVVNGVCYECRGEEAARAARLEERGIFLGR